MWEAIKASLGENGQDAPAYQGGHADEFMDIDAGNNLHCDTDLGGFDGVINTPPARKQKMGPIFDEPDFGPAAGQAPKVQESALVN